jgi:hypothetical protein
MNILIGALYIAVGVFIFWPFFWDMCGHLFNNPGSKPAPKVWDFEFAVYCLLVIPVGFFILQGLQRRYFLLITARSRKKRKIVFDESLAYNEIQSFIESARAEFEYDIVICTKE